MVIERKSLLEMRLVNRNLPGAVCETPSFLRNCESQPTQHDVQRRAGEDVAQWVIETLEQATEPTGHRSVFTSSPCANSPTVPASLLRNNLAFERASEVRHEYLDGVIYAMARESPKPWPTYLYESSGDALCACPNYVAQPVKPSAKTWVCLKVRCKHIRSYNCLPPFWHRELMAQLQQSRIGRNGNRTQKPVGDAGLLIATFLVQSVKLIPFLRKLAESRANSARCRLLYDHNDFNSCTFCQREGLYKPQHALRIDGFNTCCHTRSLLQCSIAPRRCRPL